MPHLNCRTLTFYSWTDSIVNSNGLILYVHLTQPTIKYVKIRRVKCPRTTDKYIMECILNVYVRSSSWGFFCHQESVGSTIERVADRKTVLVAPCVIDSMKSQFLFYNIRMCITLNACFPVGSTETTAFHLLRYCFIPLASFTLITFFVRRK